MMHRGRTIIDTNLRGNFLLAKKIARRMVQADTGGSIINIAAILGERVAGGFTAYCISKTGLIQLTKLMALDLGRYCIRVNALAPEYIATDLNGDFLASEAGQKLMARISQRRFGKAENLAGPLLLLVSEAGEYLTGAVIVLDGGNQALICVSSTHFSINPSCSQSSAAYSFWLIFGPQFQPRLLHARLAPISWLIRCWLTSSNKPPSIALAALIVQKPETGAAYEDEGWSFRLMLLHYQS
jgi:hypothetical protein